MTARMVGLVEQIQGQLGRALEVASASKSRLTRYAKVAHGKVERLYATMKQLTPQIRHWLKTGFVAAGKIINVHVPQLYSVVRGKIGKKVEFGLSWGIRRLGGGFLLATRALERKELVDAKFAVGAVDEHTIEEAGATTTSPRSRNVVSKRWDFTPEAKPSGW